MRALLVDDDATSRCLLRLALARHFDWAIVEANDGMQALRELETQNVDVVFLDVHMPIMDGIEMLEALRASPKHAALPVIMLTNEKDADMVRQVVALGVDDYLVKPLSAARIGARVSRAIAQHGSRPRAAGAPGGSHWLSGVSLLVDADAEFREFFKTAVSPHGSAITVESGVEALRLCSETSPQTLLVGGAIGLLTPPLLVKRLRANRLLDRLAIYMVMSEAERAQRGDIPGVNGYLTKTFVAEAFVAQLARVLGRPGAQDPDYRGTLVTAVEQAFGMMLSVDVETVDGTTGRGDGYTADVRLANADGEPGWIVALQCTGASARTIAAAFRSQPVDQVSDDDVTGALGELINIIAGRVRHTMRERGLDLQAAAAEVRATTHTASDADDSASVSLRAAGATIHVGLARAARPAAVAG